MSRLVNPFETPGRWYKANLHTHSTVSDGRLSPAERVAQYHKAGYSVLALTDHRRTQDIRGLGGKGILVVSGIEIHPRCKAPPGWWHLVGLNVPREMSFRDSSGEINRTIARLRRAGAAVILAHPGWCGQSFPDFRHMKGLDAMEVWNSVCDVAGRPSSENEWSDALDAGWRLSAVGVDDTHHAWTEDVCESWTWLRMKSLTVGNVVRAVRSGACYASCGPKVHDFRIAEGKIRLRCSPAARIHLIGTPGSGRRRRAEEGRRITSFTLPVAELSGWPWKYVRAVVTDERGRKAWTNPLWPRGRKR
ncbi:MAG TPA: CehA/McbA family metallohydrolase [Phycisphaerae bacterium]|nr:CehA/McbA family metallohydrolase [Phycisphaerae bacterium]